MADNDDKIKISELDPALTLDNTSETAVNKEVSGSWVTFKMTIATLAAHILEAFSSSSLKTINKTVVGAINELQQGGGGGGSSTLAGLTDVNVSSPTDNQVLKYDAASDKWVNGAGGGSSGDHITLTQAEYDALVQAGTVDPDAFYFIEDGSPSAYTITTLNDTPTSFGVNSEITITDDFDKYDEISFYIADYTANNYEVISFPRDLLLQCFSDYSADTSKGIFVLTRFLKVENSVFSSTWQAVPSAKNKFLCKSKTVQGWPISDIVINKIIGVKYEVVGGSNHIYSTSEQIVGTWVDGSPVYEKTIYNAGGVTGNFNFPHGITNFGKLLSYEGTVSDSGFAQYGDIWVVPRIASDGNSIGIDKVSTSSIYIINPNAFGTRLFDWYITIRYTKTAT